MRWSILLFITAFLGFHPAKISGFHIVGGELSYSCQGQAANGNKLYKIRLTIYRDCFSLNGAPFDNPAIVGIYNNNVLVQRITLPLQGVFILPYTAPSPCAPPPPNTCIEHTTYLATVSLPPAPGGYTIVYQRCCRNSTIINLINPDFNGATYMATIPPMDTGCNNSPYFPNHPPLILCRNMGFNYPHHAVDADGDSLFYTLCNAFHGGGRDNTNGGPTSPQPDPPMPPPYTIVTYAPGYSGANPMMGNPQMTINPFTGLLSVNPTVNGIHVVTVCVQEWRNGVLLGTHRRDYQFTVYACDLSKFATIRPQNLIPETYCSGLTIPFVSYSNNAKKYYWKFNDPGNAPNDTSTLQNPVYTFSDTGIYNVMLVIDAGNNCFDTTYEVYEVRIPLNVYFEAIGDPCLPNTAMTFVLKGTPVSPMASVKWNFGAASSLPTYTGTSPPIITFNTPGPHTVTLEVEDFGCNSSFSEIIRFYNPPDFKAAGSSQNVCLGAGIQFFNLSTAETPVFCNWHFGDGLTSSQCNPTHFYSIPGLYVPRLYVYTKTGCVDSAEIELPPVEVFPSPQASVAAQPLKASIFFPDITIFNKSQNSSQTQQILYISDGTIIPNPPESYKHTFSDTGKYLIVLEAVNEYGCTAYDSVDVWIYPEITLFIPNAFTPNGDGINDVFTVSVTGIVSYEISILNRWGEVIYQSTNPSDFWDGTHQGKKVPAGIYQYVIRAVDFQDVLHIRRGNIYLLL
ncbi:MAG: PKD domain-containing protein [Thermaurantimonas sp.]